MSTFATSFRRPESATRVSSRRDTTTPTPTAFAEDAPDSSSSQIQFIFLDSATPTPSATETVADVPSSTTKPVIPGATCVVDSDCGSDKPCTRGKCASVVGAAPFGPAGNSNSEPTFKLSTAAAAGLAAGIIVGSALLFALGLCIWKRRSRRPQGVSIETPPTNRRRSPSQATDKKTLVASLPNSPQNAGFRAQQECSPASFARLTGINNPLAQNPPSVAETRKQNHQRNESGVQSSLGRLSSNEKALPLSPTNMPLPPPPTEENRYALNVSINKSMIFEDMSFASDRKTPAHDSGLSRDRPPKYKFEEYVPPVAKTAPVSIKRPKRARRASDYEMKPYPRTLSASETASSHTDEEDHDDEDDETTLRRGNTLKTLESAPQLPPPTESAPSPRFSLGSYFDSYDWYEGRMVTKQAAANVPERHPAQTPQTATFGASISKTPRDTGDSLWALPSLRASSLLHPSMMSPLPSATGKPSRPESAHKLMDSSRRTTMTQKFNDSSRRTTMTQKTRASSRKSSTTHKTQGSRSWLPDDGLYLPEEGSHDSYMMFSRKSRRWSAEGRESVPSYTPL